MQLRKLVVMLTLALAAFAASAGYTVHNVEGDVTVAKKTGEVPAVKGMDLAANDNLVIGANGRIEIYNSMTKEVYSADTPGRLTVMDVMMGARKSSSANVSSINKYVRFGAQERSNTRKYTEGSVKRAMQVYDPEGGAMSVDPRQLAVNVLAGLKAGDTADVPVEVSHAPMGETGLQFRVRNTLDFPVYMNVIKVDKNGSVDISELGQPTGCSVLLPRQAMSREHEDGLAPDSRHVLVITHCQWDIDELVSAINELKASGSAETADDTLPVYQITL